MTLSRARTAAIVLLLLFGVAKLSQSSLAQDLDEDRPPIIVSTGSVIVQTTGTWTKEGNRFKQKDLRRKSVKQFSARTGTCTVEGRELTIMYGNNVIKLNPKRSTGSDKDDAEVEFPTGAKVEEAGAGVLRINTTDPLVSVTGAKGAKCAVVGNITIRQQR